MISPRKLLDCLQRTNQFTRDQYTPFYCGRIRVGWILPTMVAVLKGYPDVFVIDEQGVHIASGLADCQARTEAVSKVVRLICDRPGFGRWNDEYGAVAAAWGDEPLLYLPRCATKPFGVRSYGSHVNGFVRDGDDIRYWVARRATNGDYGGFLDTLAGGYIAAGISPTRAANSEIDEEAGVGHLSHRLFPVGRVRGYGQDSEGVTPYTVFCFDLQLGANVTPKNRDGEIESFLLLGVDQLVDSLNSHRFKFNAMPVVIDWMIRQGAVNSDDRDFPLLIDALGRWDPDD